MISLFIAIKSEKLAELMEDREFVSKLEKCKTSEEVIQLILEYGRRKGLSIKVIDRD